MNRPKFVMVSAAGLVALLLSAVGIVGSQRVASDSAHQTCVQVQELRRGFIEAVRQIEARPQSDRRLPVSQADAWGVTPKFIEDVNSLLLTPSQSHTADELEQRVPKHPC